MPLRLRLAIWYACLTSVVLGIVIVVAYAEHNQSSYADVDRSLLSTALHIRDEAASKREVDVLGNPGTPARIYNAAFELVAVPRGAPEPPLDAGSTLARRGGPASDPLVQWLPGGSVTDEGAFATAADGSTGERVRLFVLPARDTANETIYVEAWTSLGSLDASMKRFRLVMLGLGGASVLVVWAASMFMAGRVLRPIANVTDVAKNIAASGSFDKRVPEPKRLDELGQLARTFNDMLAALEGAYRAQQRFVADASHELRAPLTAIQGNLELLSGIETMTAEDRSEALYYLHREAERLSRLVAELLTLARADAGHRLSLTEVELDSVVLETTGGVAPIAQQHRLRLGAVEPVVVFGDADRLKQVVTILLDNAVKYTPAEGEILISVTNDGDRATVRVRDEGIGVPAKSLPHVFERFYRADPARQRDPGGTGLGLAIARWIVEQHGGELTLRPNDGPGVTAKLSLPAASPSGLPFSKSSAH